MPGLKTLITICSEESINCALWTWAKDAAAKGVSSKFLNTSSSLIFSEFSIILLASDAGNGLH